MDVKTATRTLEVFEAFAKGKEPQSLSDIARGLNAPLSSCLYLVRTLENLGYVYPVGARRNFYPTRKLLEMAQLIAGAEPWIERIQPALTHLRDETKETVILGKRQGLGVVYLSVHLGTQTIRYAAQAGDLKPLHSSSIGKSLLTALKPSERAKTVARMSLDAITSATKTNRAELLEELAISETRGYTETRGEHVPDVMAVAMPIHLGQDLYSIAVAGPSYRMATKKDFNLSCLRRTCAGLKNR
jgi:IclR family acetate operon transcriptional repressor